MRIVRVMTRGNQVQFPPGSVKRRDCRDVQRRVIFTGRAHEHAVDVRRCVTQGKTYLRSRRGKGGVEHRQREHPGRAAQRVANVAVQNRDPAFVEKDGVRHQACGEIFSRPAGSGNAHHGGFALCPTRRGVGDYVRYDTREVIWNPRHAIARQDSGEDEGGDVLFFSQWLFRQFFGRLFSRRAETTARARRPHRVRRGP